MKILLIVSQSSIVVGFRKKMIEKFQSVGHSIFVICGDLKYKDEIEKMGCSFYYAELVNRSSNIFKSFKYTKDIKKLAKDINPDVSMTFMLKPNTFGVRGLQKAGIKNVISMVEGLGDTFINVGFKWYLIRKYIIHLYKRSFKYVDSVIFLNDDDMKLFKKLKIVNDDNCLLIDGIGVDSKKYEFTPLPNNHNFLMISRLLVNKGVYEYCEAARIVRKMYPSAKFSLIGDEGNIKFNDLKKYIDSGDITYLGFQKDVIPFIKDSFCYVLPSYREGMPVSIMEAMSIGRPIITTDVAGCHQVVTDNYNGFLCKAKDVDSLVLAMTNMINSDSLDLFSKNSRNKILNKYSSEIINNKLLEIIENMKG